MPSEDFTTPTILRSVAGLVCFLGVVCGAGAVGWVTGAVGLRLGLLAIGASLAATALVPGVVGYIGRARFAEGPLDSPVRGWQRAALIALGIVLLVVNHLVVTRFVPNE